MAQRGSASDADIRAVLRQLVRRYGKSRLLEIELIEEYEPKSLADLGPAMSITPYKTLPLTRLPRYSRLKIRLALEESKTGRRIKAVASTRTQNGRVRHTATVDSSELETLRNEVKKEAKKEVKRKPVKEVLDYIIKIVQLVISLINALITAGFIRTK